MKTLFAIVVAALVGVVAAFAHEPGEHASTEGLFGLKPEYIHTLLNPIPVYGLALGAFSLILALVARNKTAQVISLALLVLCAVSAWPVLFFGQHGYNHLAPQLDTESKQWLDVHMHRAERFIYSFYATAILGIAALVAFKKFPRGAIALSVFTLLASLASLGIGGWISRAGGQVSHSEFRDEGASSPSAPAQHDGHEHGGEKMQTTNTSGGHQHDTTKQSQAEKPRTPDTPEAIWKEIHKHHSELEPAMTGKTFGEGHPHTDAIRELLKALVAIAHPSHKAAVQSGADKINRALDDLHKSAEAGNETASEANFKQFGEALNQLEEQMKKQ